MLGKLIPILVFFFYGYFGYEVNLPKVMVTSLMLGKAKQRFSQLT